MNTDIPSEDGNWDYIVVGAGSAGCTLTNRLTASGVNKVLLLEAGPQDTWMMKPTAMSWYFDLSRYEWHYWSQPDPSRDGRNEQWRRGRVIGGTSSINGMSFVRGARADYDRWSAMGNRGWSAADVMPIFRSLEKLQSDFRKPPDYSIRGNAGPLSVRQVRHCHPLTEAYLQSCQALGIPFNDDYNGAAQDGVGYGQFNQRRGMRCSAAEAFLKPALGRQNLKVLTGAHVHRLLIEQGRVVGVRYEIDGAVRVARAEKVVLSGGSINTPKILMLSGIGDPEHLGEHGIAVNIARPSVGRNLMEHPLMRPGYRSRIPSYNPSEGLLQKIGFFAKFLFLGQGPISTPFEGQSFLRTSPSESHPDIQIHFCPVGMVYSNDKANHKGLTVLPYPAFSFFVNKSHPKSRGRITLAGPAPEQAPLIDPNLLGDERDVQTMVAALRLVRRIASTAPLSDLILDEIEPGPKAVTDDDLAQYVRSRVSLSYHPAGTCRMGVDDDAVVTPDQKVRGVDNLWIADASIMPDHISGNINAVCMMMGEKLGLQLTGANSRP